jgi:hypothetical protein
MTSPNKITGSERGRGGSCRCGRVGPPASLSSLGGVRPTRQLDVSTKQRFLLASAVAVTIVALGCAGLETNSNLAIVLGMMILFLGIYWLDC